MGIAPGGHPAQVGRLGGRDASRSRFLGTSANTCRQESTRVTNHYLILLRTCLIMGRTRGGHGRSAFTHTQSPLWRPFQTSVNLLEADAMSPSFEMFSESTQERGRMVWEPQTLRRMWTILFLRPNSFGASKACVRKLNRVRLSLSRPPDRGCRRGSKHHRPAATSQRSHPPEMQASW